MYYVRVDVLYQGGCAMLGWMCYVRVDVLSLGGCAKPMPKIAEWGTRIWPHELWGHDTGHGVTPDDSDPQRSGDAPKDETAGWLPAGGSVVERIRNK